MWNKSYRIPPSVELPTTPALKSERQVFFSLLTCMHQLNSWRDENGLPCVEA